MQTAATAEPGFHPAFLFGGSQSFWEQSLGEANFPVSSKSLGKRHNGGKAGLGFTFTAVATVAAIAGAYLVFRCVLYLANFQRSKTPLRFLSGKEWKTNDDGVGLCGAPAEGSPALAAVANEEEEEALVEKGLLGRAHCYVAGLKRLVVASQEPLLLLNPDMRARCVAELLCLCVVELSALFSLLKRKEREAIQALISEISATIQDISKTLGRKHLSRSRLRHIKCLHVLLNQITEIEPAAAAFEVGQRTVRIQQLLQLQEVALQQVDTGLMWLGASLEDSDKANDDVKAATAAAEGTASATEGVTSDAEGAATGPIGATAAFEAVSGASQLSATETGGDAAPPESTDAACEAKITPAVKAIEATTHKRREQVLGDPKLSNWLRKNQPTSHYGIIDQARLGVLSRRPPKSHKKLLTALLATPLGSGDEPWELAGHKGKDVQHRRASFSVRKAPTKGGSVSPEGGSRDLGDLQTFSREGSRTALNAIVYAPASSSPSTSMGAACAAAAAAPTAAATADGASEAKHTNLLAPGRRKTVSPCAVPNIPSQASLAAVVHRSRVSALSATPKTAAVSLHRDRSTHATWAAKVSDAKLLVRPSVYYAGPEASPTPPLSSFTAAVSAAAAYFPEAVTLSTPGVPSQFSVDPPISAASGSSAVAHGVLPSSAASQPSPAASILQVDGPGSSVNSQRHRRGAPVLPLFQLQAANNRSSSPATVTVARPLQAKGAYDLALRTAEKVGSEYSAACVQASASQPLSAPPCRPPEPHSLLKTASPEPPVGIFDRLHSSRVWWPLKGTHHTLLGQSLSTREPTKPSPADIAEGFKQLAKLFSRAPVQTLGEAVQSTQDPVPAANPVPDAAASAGVAELSRAPTKSVGEIPSHWRQRSDWVRGPSFRF